MATLTRPQAHTLLLEGVRCDLRDAGAIHALLERQFDAAVRHRSGDLANLAEALAPPLEAMEARRRQRLQLVRALLGHQATMAAYIASLAPPAAAAFQQAWLELEQRVRTCQAATARNGQLLAEQHGVMQRVLHGEELLYAP